MPGPPVQSVFADLGVAQHTKGALNLELLDVRERRALHKMSRVQALRLSFGWRARMVAVSGLPTAMYGVEAQPISDQRVRALRRAAFLSIWQSSGRAAREILFTLHVTWRADPLALAIVRPVTQMRMALREGLLTPKQPQEMMEMPERVGPIAAFHKALKRG